MSAKTLLNQKQEKNQFSKAQFPLYYGLVKVEMRAPLSLASFEVWAPEQSLLPSQLLLTYCYVPPLPWEDLFHAATQVISFADYRSI